MVINKENWRMTDDNEIIKEDCEEIRNLWRLNTDKQKLKMLNY